MINQQRVWDRLMKLSEIGKQESGGITRLSFSKEERAAKSLVGTWMREAGLQVSEDAVGNLIGRKEGQNPTSPVVLVGSHIDSVYNGGNFDGPLGVIGGIEAAQTMLEQGVETKHPIEVVAFTDEEGARFSFGMIGSRAMAGTLQEEHLLTAKDAEGVSVAEAMLQVGFDPKAIQQAVREKGSVKAYVELHIEQGKVLEQANQPIGIVSGIAGPLWLKFHVQGEAGHAGTTPMHMRNDALAAAAQMFEVIEREASSTSTTVGTVGQLQVHPGGINIIPGEVEFTLDLRDVDETIRDHVEQKIREGVNEICVERNVHVTITELQRVPPAPCSEFVQEAAKNATVELGIEPTVLASGAGHDGMQLRELCPIGMLFVRSKDGISHNPKEWSTPEDCATGVQALYQTVLQLASK